MEFGYSHVFVDLLGMKWADEGRIYGKVTGNFRLYRFNLMIMSMQARVCDLFVFSLIFQLLSCMKRQNVFTSSSTC